MPAAQTRTSTAATAPPEHRRLWLVVAIAVLAVAWGLLPAPAAAQVPPVDVQAIAAGTDFTCAIVADDTVRCWGGQLLGRTSSPADLGTVIAIAAGDRHACAITTNSDLRCWGYNNLGQTDVPDGLDNVTAIAAGNNHTCAITSPVGTARCWGHNSSGQTDVPDGLQAAAITAGSSHTCAITTDHTTHCWGNNNSGQTDVPDGLQPTAITAGQFHTCAITADGTARCWGNSGSGQTDVPDGLGPVADITAGSYYTCAITNDGTPHCWGDNSLGQSSPPASEPLRVISAAGSFTCAVDVDDRPLCWGRAPGGVLGGPPLLDLPPSPAALTGQPYRYRAFTQGAPLPRIVLADGTLPDGLTLAPTGAITGTPTTPGEYTFTLAAVNDVHPTTLGQVTLTIDPARPDVTVEQAADQSDPTTARRVRFDITFTEPVTGLDPADLIVDGTATTATPTLTGDGATYTATIRATSNGTITLDVPADVATTADGGTNTASTSTDNTITVNAPPPPAPAPPPPAPAPPAATDEPERTGDTPSPLDAAIDVAEQRGAPEGLVVLARVDLPADAIAGSVYLADAPLLFTDPNTLPTTVANQIDTLLPDGGEVIILGGPTAIPPDAQTAIEQAGHTTTRLSGPTRVETAIAIANDVLDRFGAPNDVGIARSHTITDDPTAAWADTVAAGGWAALTRTPILLTPTDQPHPAVAAWLDTNQPPTRTVLGGTAAITPDTAQALGATRRVAGEDRSTTAVAIADQLINDTPTGYYLTSNTHPDGWTHALLAAGLTADTGQPLLTTPTTTLAPPINDATCRTADRAPVTILGPTTVISHDVADALTQPCPESDN